MLKKGKADDDEWSWPLAARLHLGSHPWSAVGPPPLMASAVHQMQSNWWENFAFAISTFTFKHNQRLNLIFIIYIWGPGHTRCSDSAIKHYLTNIILACLKKSKSNLPIFDRQKSFFTILLSTKTVWTYLELRNCETRNKLFQRFTQHPPTPHFLIFLDTIEQKWSQLDKKWTQHTTQCNYFHPIEEFTPVPGFHCIHDVVKGR